MYSARLILLQLLWFKPDSVKAKQAFTSAASFCKTEVEASCMSQLPWTGHIGWVYISRIIYIYQRTCDKLKTLCRHMRVFIHTQPRNLYLVIIYNIFHLPLSNNGSVLQIFIHISTYIHTCIYRYLLLYLYMQYNNIITISYMHIVYVSVFAYGKFYWSFQSIDYIQSNA